LDVSAAATGLVGVHLREHLSLPATSKDVQQCWGRGRVPCLE